MKFLLSLIQKSQTNSESRFELFSFLTRKMTNNTNQLKLFLRKIPENSPFNIRSFKILYRERYPQNTQYRSVLVLFYFFQIQQKSSPVLRTIVYSSFHCRFGQKGGEITVTFREPILLVSVWIGARRDNNWDSDHYSDFVDRYHYTRIFVNDNWIGIGLKQSTESILGLCSSQNLSLRRQF